MAIRYQCDRCKRFIKNTYETTINNAKDLCFYISSNQMEDDQDFHDLCEDCYQSFIRWWNAPEDKEV